jgi:hypothetical protein
MTQLTGLDAAALMAQFLAADMPANGGPLPAVPTGITLPDVPESCEADVRANIAELTTIETDLQMKLKYEAWLDQRIQEEYVNVLAVSYQALINMFQPTLDAQTELTNKINQLYPFLKLPNETPSQFLMRITQEFQMAVASPTN